jgi:hypothetical protein
MMRKSHEPGKAARSRRIMARGTSRLSAHFPSCLLLLRSKAHDSTTCRIRRSFLRQLRFRPLDACSGMRAVSHDTQHTLNVYLQPIIRISTTLILLYRNATTLLPATTSGVNHPFPNSISYLNIPRNRTCSLHHRYPFSPLAQSAAPFMQGTVRPIHPIHPLHPLQQLLQLSQTSLLPLILRLQLAVDPRC